MAALPRIALLDYGSGNIRSAERALSAIGGDVTITSDYQVAVEADGLFVPGVGAFGHCMNGLRAIRGDEIIKERLREDRPTLGVCVGLQVLFASSTESAVITGISVFDESIERLPADILPHMGWNLVDAPSGSLLFDGVERERFYFVHSYARVREVSASKAPIYSPSWSFHGARFLAALEFGSLTATQFHPEKSGDAGLHLLENWVTSLS